MMFGFIVTATLLGSLVIGSIIIYIDERMAGNNDNDQ